MMLRLLKDESGMTMGLAVIMIVLIGVMGAGLLTFVNRDLNSVVEVNQGQKAFEMADAGAQAARAQLTADPDASSYDGSDTPVVDNQWAASKGGKNLTMNGNSANVKIEGNQPSTGLFRVTSTGTASGAKRKIQVIYEVASGLNLAEAFFTRGSFVISGSATPEGVSFFAMGQAIQQGNPSLGSQADGNYGKWAQTTDQYSYPNNYNKTPRTSFRGGVAALGNITGFPLLDNGTRNFGFNTVPSTVQLYPPGPLSSTKIAFPFAIPTPEQDKQTIDRLRQRALKLEQSQPGTGYYIDSNPGNGVDDTGRANGSLDVANWPADSSYETVRFYEFQTYNSSNRVSYGTSATLPNNCPGTNNAPSGSARGVIVVQNGDVSMSGSRAFYGGVVVRAYDSSGNLLPPTTLTPTSGTNYSSNATNWQNGGFQAEGNACLRGFANASGNMNVGGNVKPGDIPDLNLQAGFASGVRVLSWRELYE